MNVCMVCGHTFQGEDWRKPAELDYLAEALRGVCPQCAFERRLSQPPPPPEGDDDPTCDICEKKTAEWTVCPACYLLTCAAHWKGFTCPDCAEDRRTARDDIKDRS